MHGLKQIALGLWEEEGEGELYLYFISLTKAL